MVEVALVFRANYMLIDGFYVPTALHAGDLERVLAVIRTLTVHTAQLTSFHCNTDAFKGNLYADCRFEARVILNDRLAMINK